MAVLTPVTPGTSVGVTSPQSVKSIMVEQLYNILKRPQGGNVISQVCLWLGCFLFLV